MDTLDHEHANNVGLFRGFMAGLLLGGMSGAGAMLLLAPQSGKKTRSGIQRKSVEVRKQVVRGVEDATEEVRSKAVQIAHDVREQAGDLQQRGQDALDEQRDNLGQTLKDLGKAVHS